MLKLNSTIPVSDLTEITDVALSAEDIERHDIFMSLTMSLVHDSWRIKEDNQDQHQKCRALDPDREFEPYDGHNIGAILVNQDHGIVSFSRNECARSRNCTDQAEARLISLAVRDTGANPNGYQKALTGHTIYTNLEPSFFGYGMMDLANVGMVVYGQSDPGQSRIGNILYNIHKDEGCSGAPVPLKADFLALSDELENAFKTNGGARLSRGSRRPGAARFLQTVEAYQVFRDAARHFDDLEPVSPANIEILKSARIFRQRNRTPLSGSRMTAD